MGIYSLRQKIRYRLKAKTRHGIHSPFVYEFIEQLLLSRFAGIDCPVAISGGLNGRQQYLLTAIAGCYQVRELVWGRERAILNPRGAGCLYLFADKDMLPEQYSEHDVVLVPDIYANSRKTKEWIGLYQNDKVMLSIDVFEMGIMFFKKEFKIKQHFILNYR